MKYKFSSRSKENLSGVCPEMANLMEKAIEISPIDFGIPSDGGLRTAEQQRKLFEAGKSKCDGFYNKSYHQSGLAVDVYAYVNGAASWDGEHLAMIAGVVLSVASELNLDVIWGGTFGSNTFKGWDKPHFELRK